MCFGTQEDYHIYGLDNGVRDGASILNVTLSAADAFMDECVTSTRRVLFKALMFGLLIVVLNYIPEIGPRVALCFFVLLSCWTVV